MAQHVTPDMIYLLMLIEIYWRGAVPESATISILSYITRRVTPKIGGSSNKDLDIASTLSVDLVGLKELLLSTQHTQGGGYLYTNLWEAFVDQLAELNSFHTMAFFFARCDHFFDCLEPHNIQLHPTSLFATFVRKTLLEFETLLFYDVMKLWREFDIDRTRVVEEHHGEAAAGHDLQAFHRVAGDRTLEVINMSMDDPNVKQNALSLNATSRLLEFQIERMQNFGARLPIELRNTLKQTLAASNDSLPALHHTHFLDAWYAGDYASAFDNLHRYYDYAMLNNDRSQYQYALLDMAILHADFGCHSEAVTAINEAIAAARESKDMPCLTFSLSWLYFFQTRADVARDGDFQRSILGSGASGLEYIASEARKYEMWSIESSIKLSEAATCLSKGHKPREIFERINESSHLNLLHNLSSSTSAEVQAVSSLFDSLGIKDISQSYSSLVTECYKSTTPIEGVVRSRCSTAEFLTTAGKYVEAFALLSNIQHDASSNLRLSQYLAQVTGILKLKKAVLNHDLSTAESLLLAVKASSRSDPQFSLTITLLEVDYLTKLRSLSAAFDLIDSALSKSEEQNPATDVRGRLRLLNAKAMLFVKAGRPQKGFSLAMRAATAAFNAKILPELWQAVGVLGNVLCGLECYAVAKDLLLAVVYQAMETKNVALYSFLEKTLADAFIGMAHLNKDDIKARDAALHDALQWTTAACTSFEKIEDVKNQQEMRARIKLLSRAVGSGKLQKEAN